MKQIVLASQSPRRQELLSYLVESFKIEAADIDETPIFQESAEDYVLRLAEQKALTVLGNQTDDCIVIGSDTAVVCDGTILGKPTDFADCKRMLLMLSGRKHQVLTSYCVATKTQKITKLVSTEVLFKVIDDAEIYRYWQTNEPADKAGSYAIQGIGGKFVKSISGSVSAVIGLPLVEVEQALQEIITI